MRFVLGFFALSVVVAGCVFAEAPDPPSGGGAGDNVTPPRVDDFCEYGSLSYGPTPLPAARKGTPYCVDLKGYADRSWYGESYQAGHDIPSGLSLDENCILSGTPIATGTFRLSVYANHAPVNGCSIIPDPHSFDLDIIDDPDASADAEAPMPKPPR